jgi:hypothetical protein
VPVPLADIEDDYLRRVERDRQRRERDLLVLLVAFFDTAPNSVRRQAIVAASHGFDVGIVIRNAVGGGPNHKGVAPVIARTMAQAHRDGYRRVGLEVGTRDVQRADAGTIGDLMPLYRPQADVAAQAMVQAIIDLIYETLRTRTPDVPIREAVGEAFDLGGYSMSSPRAVKLAAEIAVVGAHSGGVFDAIHTRPDLKVTGIGHVTIADGRETDICHDRIGLVLPVGHPYWTTNVPGLHYGCRSALKPLFGDVEFSETLPTIPPMPGFGGGPLPGFARAA